jgi:hypothetical protein
VTQESERIVVDLNLEEIVEGEEKAMPAEGNSNAAMLS